MWLIVGLGNPGARYDRTRHNLGFMAIDRLARHWEMEQKAGLKWVLAKGSRQGEELLLVKPLTYMNRSGGVVAPLARRHGLDGTRILVIVDDMDLPLGTLRYRPRGSTAGHRGMDSLVSALGTDEFRRIRIGIGRPEDGDEQVSHVLSRFRAEEWPRVEKVLDAAVGLVEEVVYGGRIEPQTIKLPEE